MVNCCIKKCKNDTRRRQKNDGVSYFRFPQNEIRREEWRQLVSKERGEEFFKPKDTYVICSDHFMESDMYYTSKGLRRVKKSAIPCIEVNTVASVDSWEQPSTSSTGLSASSQLSKSQENLGDIVPETLCPQSLPEKSLLPHITGNNPNTSSPTSSGLTSLLDTPKTTFFKNTLRKCRKRLEFKSKQVKNLKKQNQRLKKKITSLQEVINDLKKKRYVDESLCNNLSRDLKKTDTSVMDLLTAKKKIAFAKYPPQLRKFALTVNFYSPAAYKYVRQALKCKLPHHSTLFRWYQSVNAQPGFTEEAFSRLAEKSKTVPLLCALVADEMSIRQQKLWTGNKYEGFVDMGTGSDESDVRASQAYVFIIVSLDQSWTLPIAYFFIHSITGEMKANLINIALQKCHEVGVKVVSVTFDGCKSNINCMKTLGCNLDNYENMRTVFKHPSGDHEVAVFLDACHMIKLIRNVLESKKNIFKNNNEIIKWEYIVSLHNLQEELSLHFANKLTLRHIHFRNEIMKVKLATQLLSKSVAKAIEFCDKKMKIKEFAHSEATVKFISLINDLFDILNSRNLNDFGYQQPLNLENSSEVLSFLSNVKKYLLALETKTIYKKTKKVNKEIRVVYESKQEPLYKSRANTGVIGLLICINSLEYLYSALIETNSLSYLTMYKFSQDHVEIFFGKIRSQGGYNNNPNTRQFKSAYKKLLTHMELGAKFSGNCLPLENLPILQGGTSIQKINNTTAGYRHDEDEENISKLFVQRRINREQVEENYRSNCDHLSETLEGESSDVTNQIVGYISGFVVYHLLKQLHCDDCKNHLLATGKKWFHKLIEMKDVGGLCYASEDVFMICSKSENIIRNLLKLCGGKRLLKKYDKPFITMKVLRSLIDINIFTKTDAHTKDQFNHMYDLTKAVIEKFVDVRLHYICKKENVEKKYTSKRQVYNKLNLFQGQ